VVISNEPIAFPHVLRADLLVAMSQSAYDAFIDQTVQPDGLVLYDASLVEERPREGVRQLSVPAAETAVSELHNKQAANIVMLGAATARSGVVSRRALEAAVREEVPERFLELNLRALTRGWEMGLEMEETGGGR
jgi:2-oxoglutarate ferredoxin oxidoreductase subunit gamma